MDTNDFLGSFAQENVAFQTQIIRTRVVGDNYWKVMVFVENTRFVTSSSTDWVDAPGLTGVRCCTVTADTYGSITRGLLKSWLYDLFANKFTGDCILVACGEDVPAPVNPGDPVDPSAFITAMEAAYDVLKPYAYHKTVCAGSDDALLPAIAVSLATKCAEDKQLLSSAPYYPFTTATPDSAVSDPIYAALTAAQKDAFMSCHADASTNSALYSLGLALATLNGSGTAVGSQLDMIKSLNITASGADGTNLSRSIRDYLLGLNIQSFKPVGDNTGAVAAQGDTTLKGEIVAVDWIIAYITYMSKVRIAQMITSPGFLKNAENYTRLLSVLTTYLPLFGENGSGRLSNIVITAPAFEDLPASKSQEIIIPNAWSATYTDHVRSVQISGTLYIGA